MQNNITKYWHFKELQAAKKGAKASTQAASSMEVRMNRALEEAESLRSTLMNRRGQERVECILTPKIYC
jgi:hypothetical protein